MQDVPQSIDSYLEQLKDPEPRLRYEAVCFFARSLFTDRYREVYDAVWVLTDDIYPQVRWGAGIAASMMSARHMPIMYPDMPSILGGYIPDFLTEWGVRGA